MAKITTSCHISCKCTSCVCLRLCACPSKLHGPLKDTSTWVTSFQNKATVLLSFASFLSFIFFVNRAPVLGQKFITAIQVWFKTNTENYFLAFFSAFTVVLQCSLTCTAGSLQNCRKKHKHDGWINCLVQFCAGFKGWGEGKYGRNTFDLLAAVNKGL